jgi:hypothetical protein
VEGKPVDVVPEHGVAFTGDAFERRPIDDLNDAATVMDRAGTLEQAGGDCHCGAAHAKHLPEKLLC